jgi:hypothetical protein
VSTRARLAEQFQPYLLAAVSDQAVLPCWKTTISNLQKISTARRAKAAREGLASIRSFSGQATIA